MHPIGVQGAAWGLAVQGFYGFGGISGDWRAQVSKFEKGLLGSFKVSIRVFFPLLPSKDKARNAG